jgi:hypothetical protein
MDYSNLHRESCRWQIVEMQRRPKERQRGQLHDDSNTADKVELETTEEDFG